MALPAATADAVDGGTPTKGTNGTGRAPTMSFTMAATESVCRVFIVYTRSWRSYNNAIVRLCTTARAQQLIPLVRR